MTSKLKALGDCSSYHLQGAGHIVAAALQAAQLVSSFGDSLCWANCILLWQSCLCCFMFVSAVKGYAHCWVHTEELRNCLWPVSVACVGWLDSCFLFNWPIFPQVAPRYASSPNASKALRGEYWSWHFFTGWCRVSFGVGKKGVMLPLMCVKKG